MSKYLCAVTLLAASWTATAKGPSSPPPGFDSPAVPAKELGLMRGGADTVTNTMRLDGAVSGNAAVNVLSGANSIGSGSFSNASGLPTAIQNSGANVLIQNATIINIEMK